MLTPSKALEIIALCNAFGNFHALPSSVVDSLLTEADRMKYRRPKNANGSRARYFHAYLYRRAESLTGQAREMAQKNNASVRLSRGGRSVWAHSD